ncbi:MAG TPA: hypothetical protein VIM27_01450 [Gaiellales bacterium]|jgi:hypothetical protein
MPTHTLARGSALAGLAAASATVAHGGTAALADPAWSLPALVAAAAGTAALLRLTASARSARVAAARVHETGAAFPAHTPLGLSETIAIMLAAQGCAHLALLAAGASAHPGQFGAVALHVALGILGAVAVWAADRTLSRALGELNTAVAAARELLLAVLAVAYRPPAGAPAGRLPLAGRHGRAPPAPA